MAEKLTYEKVLQMFAETDKRLDKRFAETDRQFKETDKRLRRTEALINGIGKSNGMMAEELFFNALAKKKKIGTIAFEKIEKNRQVYDPKTLETLDEIDILLMAKNKLALIEIKYKVTLQDIANLVAKKTKHFLTGFPQHRDKDIYLGIGGCSFEPKALTLAQHNEIAVFKIDAGVVLDKTKKLKVFSNKQ